MRAERLNAMEQYILGKETVSLEELSTQFSVSMNTIRRDVMELLSRGNIRKVYGGVSSTLINRPVGFSVRAQKNSRAKQIIGRLASQLVSDGASIFLDSGSTTPYILQHIGEKNGVTVITHSLTALYAASSLSNLNIIALGGIYAPATSSFTGISTLDALSRLSIQTIFISATGVSIENGLTNSTYLEAEIKRSVVLRGNRVVLMADQSKFGHSAVISFCPFEQLYAIVTDCLPSEPYLEAIERYGIRLICPGHESD